MKTESEQIKTSFRSYCRAKGYKVVLHSTKRNPFWVTCVVDGDDVNLKDFTKVERLPFDENVGVVRTLVGISTKDFSNTKIHENLFITD